MTYLLFFYLLLIATKVLLSTAASDYQCFPCLEFPESLISDGQLFSILLITNWLSTRSPYNVLSYLLKGLIVASLLFVAIDLALYATFHTRLSIEYIIKFSGELDIMADYVLTIIKSSPIMSPLIIASIIIVIITFILKHEKQSRTRDAIYLSFVILFLGAGNIYSSNSGNDWVYSSAFAVIKDNTRSTAYSPDFTKALLEETRNNEIASCNKGINEKKNVILLVLESLSPHHSKHFIAEESHVPYFDKMVEDGTLYTNFFANGSTTEEGLIALLTARIPITGPKILDDVGTNFKGFYFFDQTLPKALNEANYQTSFLTTGNLDFLNKGLWLKSIGFDYIEGSEYPFYDNWERFAFDAAADEALYLRATEYIDNKLQQTSPYFLLLETVTTHSPYVDPVSKERSEFKSFRYADKQMWSFYQYLRQSDFFENGILIVVGDHRIMKPVKKIEEEAYGLSASARTPMLIIGHSNIEQNTGHFQQIDFLSSFQSLLTDQSSCTDELHGNFLVEPLKTARCVVHTPLLNRNEVIGICGSNSYNITLNGDNTIIKNNIDSSDKTAEWLLDTVNLQRIKHDENTINN